jgi:hypothetical protein
MTAIKIHRPADDYNHLRAYGIYIDGKKVDTILIGQSKEFALTPGQHTLYTKIDWCRTPKVSFKVPADGIKTFKVYGSKLENRIMLLIPIIILLQLILKYTIGIDYSLYLLILISFLLFYYLRTFRGKRYISLTEVSQGISYAG